jgi:hypothetical protein
MKAAIKTVSLTWRTGSSNSSTRSDQTHSVGDSFLVPGSLMISRFVLTSCIVRDVDGFSVAVVESPRLWRPKAAHELMSRITNPDFEGVCSWSWHIFVLFMLESREGRQAEGGSSSVLDR